MSRIHIAFDELKSTIQLQAAIISRSPIQDHASLWRKFLDEHTTRRTRRCRATQHNCQNLRKLSEEHIRIFAEVINLPFLAAEPHFVGFFLHWLMDDFSAVFSLNHNLSLFFACLENPSVVQSALAVLQSEVDKTFYYDDTTVTLSKLENQIQSNGFSVCNESTFSRYLMSVYRIVAEENGWSWEPVQERASGCCFFSMCRGTEPEVVYIPQANLALNDDDLIREMAAVVGSAEKIADVKEAWRSIQRQAASRGMDLLSPQYFGSLLPLLPYLHIKVLFINDSGIVFPSLQVDSDDNPEDWVSDIAEQVPFVMGRSKTRDMLLFFALRKLNFSLASSKEQFVYKTKLLYDACKKSVIKHEKGADTLDSFNKVFLDLFQGQVRETVNAEVIESRNRRRLVVNRSDTVTPEAPDNTSTPEPMSFSESSVSWQIPGDAKPLAPRVNANHPDDTEDFCSSDFGYESGEPTEPKGAPPLPPVMPSSSRTPLQPGPFYSRPVSSRLYIDQSPSPDPTRTPSPQIKLQVRAAKNRVASANANRLSRERTRRHYPEQEEFTTISVRPT